MFYENDEEETSKTVKELVGDISTCQEKVKELFDKYEGSEYMIQRMKYHILSLLPNTLENECKNYEKRIIRKDYLTNEQQQFVQVFLNENKYYYLSSNGYFYFYNGKSYCIVREDIIHHQLLTTISKDRILMDWKYKTKSTIMKRIKERSLFSTIPETETIQCVLGLLTPSLFNNRDEVKYFLAIVGDCLLKKQSDITYLIRPKTRKYLQSLDTVAQMSVGTLNIFSNFVTKNHENYNYDHCRLLNMNKTMSIDIWHDILNKYGLDILCVASHYSNRYESSENYIHNLMENDEVKRYTLFMKENKPETIINTFCAEYIQDAENGDDSPSYSIQWKNMHYIWKQFLSQRSLPNVVFLNTFKALLKDKYEYNDNIDGFMNITSKYLPHISNFIQFWSSSINTSIVEEDKLLETEFEIDEIVFLYKKWCNDNDISGLNNMSELEVLKIINHFFPTVDIVDNKYILGIECNLWNKQSDINTVLVKLKSHYKMNSQITNNSDTMIAFDDAYEFYSKNCVKPSKSHRNVSKQYFSKYISSKLCDYIEYDNFISHSWYI